MAVAPDSSEDWVKANISVTEAIVVTIPRNPIPEGVGMGGETNRGGGGDHLCNPSYTVTRLRNSPPWRLNCILDHFLKIPNVKFLLLNH